MGSVLDRIQRGPVIMPRRVLLYGVQGIGKSTWANGAPEAIFIPTEDGLNDIDCDSFPLCASLADVQQAITDLATEKHPFQTVVIDSLDWLEKLIVARVCQNKVVTSIEDIGYGKGWVFATAYWRGILDGLTILRDAGMTVVLLAHSKIEKFENPETESYHRYSVALHRFATSMVQEWCDECLFATYKVFTKKLKEGFNQERTQAIGSGDRVIRTSERPSHAAKNRLNLPDEIPLTWAAYAEHFPTPPPINGTKPHRQVKTKKD